MDDDVMMARAIPTRHGPPRAHASTNARATNGGTIRAAWTRAVTTCVMLLVAAACGDDGGVAPIQGEIRITPANPTVSITETVRLAASMDGAGAAGRSFHWSSDNDAVASVDATGMVTPHAVGSVRIAASTAGLSAITTVNVSPEHVTEVEVTPATSSMAVGDTIQLAVTTRGESGAELTDRAIQLTSDAPTVVAVIDGLRLVGLAEGSATITATSDGRSSTATVEVSRAGVATVEITPDSLSLGVATTARLGIIVRDRTGELMDPTLVTFASSDSAVATVSGDGVVTAVAPGRAEIVGTAGEVSARVSVEVVREAVGRVTITPTTASIPAGGSTRLTVTVADASGRELTGRQVTWRSTDGSVATVTDSGRVRGIAIGVAVITATVEGVSASAGITVTRARVATVTISPENDTLVVGDSVTLEATLRDASEDPVPGATVAWNSETPSVATVASSGRVLAVAPGTTVVTATSDGVSATATIVVEEAPAEPPPEEPPPEEPPPEEPPPEEPPPEEPPEEPVPGAPSQLVIVSGDNQTGDRNRTLDEKLVVQVVDDAGVPVPGVWVWWWASNGGVVTPDSDTTGADGTVAASWRLGSANGEQSATASYLLLSNITFHAKAEQP